MIEVYLHIIIAWQLPNTMRSQYLNLPPSSLVGLDPRKQVDNNLAWKSLLCGDMSLYSNHWFHCCPSPRDPHYSRDPLLFLLLLLLSGNTYAAYLFVWWGGVIVSDRGSCNYRGGPNFKAERGWMCVSPGFLFMICVSTDHSSSCKCFTVFILLMYHFLMYGVERQRRFQKTAGSFGVQCV